MNSTSRSKRQHTLVNGHNSPQSATTGYTHYAWIPARLRVYGHAVELCPSRPAQRCSRVGGGIRGLVDGFSYKARRRLMQTVSRINTGQLGCMGFVTLTYHENWRGRDIKRDLDNYLKRIRRHFPDVAYLWRLEYQKRGAPHFHVLLFFPPHQSDKSQIEESKLSDPWHSVVDEGNIHHAKHGSKVRVFEDGYQGVQIYATKYCAKLESDGVKKLDGVGKYWGRSQNLPLGPTDEVVMSDSQDANARRYCRRFLKGRKNASAQRYANTVVQGHKSEVFLKDNEVGFAVNMIDLVRRENEALQPLHCAAHTLPFVQRVTPLFHTNDNINSSYYEGLGRFRISEWNRDFSDNQKTSRGDPLPHSPPWGASVHLQTGVT